MNDFLKMQGIFEQGYGVIPKKVMRDKDITPEAKAIYAYISSFAGAGAKAFPSAELMWSELGIAEKRFYKHRKLLIEHGYIKIHKRRNGKRRDSNIYEIVVEPVKQIIHEHSQNERVQNEHSQNERVQNEHSQNERVQNEGGINNSLINNSLINNKDLSSSSSSNITNPYVFYQQNFGVLNSYIGQTIEAWVKDTDEELVIAAMQRALKQQKKWSYAEGILKTWVNNNIFTLEQVEAVEKEFAERAKKKGGAKNATGRGRNKGNNEKVEPRRESTMERLMREQKASGQQMDDIECDF